MTAAGFIRGANGPRTHRRAPILVTGGAGFIGCNLADRLAREGHDVLVFDALMRPGVDANLAWLKRRHPTRISAAVADVRDETAVTGAIREASAVFHFAAQVAVTTSLEDPYRDFDINLRGTLLLLEALRRRRDRIPFIFASSNKVYGDLGEIELERNGEAYQPRLNYTRTHGIGEDQPLSLRTPYGCSKGAADQYVLDYARSFGLPTAVMRMSCIYGQRQLGTEDQGWIAHFARSALARQPITIYGDGNQTRAFCYVDDLIEGFVRLMESPAEVTGPVNLGNPSEFTIRELAELTIDMTGSKSTLTFLPLPQDDPKQRRPDITLAEKHLGWKPTVPLRDGLKQTIAYFDELLSREGEGTHRGGAPFKAQRRKQRVR